MREKCSIGPEDALPSTVVSPDEVKRLRKELAITGRQLAQAVGVDDNTVFAWESGEQFPTKRYVDKMQALLAAGADAFPGKRPNARATGVARLRDPELWDVFAKLVAHPALLEQVRKLAAEFPTPED
ncbi:MAG: helix-turn-helix transcriptional regulator [Polyangiaceae bacterium]|nr:helix-turn-helix transcriptional regulator [Polyangiaceae bacterium]